MFDYRRQVIKFYKPLVISLRLFFWGCFLLDLTFWDCYGKKYKYIDLFKKTDLDLKNLGLSFQNNLDHKKSRSVLRQI